MQAIKAYIKNPRQLGLAIIKKINSIIPDNTYLKLRYYFEMGEKCDLKNPQRFTEKLQWLKLNDRKPEYTMMVDKLAVKKYVAERIGEECITPTIDVWDDVNEIDFAALPEKFVLKTTHGGGSCGVVICKDKKLFDINKAKEKIAISMKSKLPQEYREYPYIGVERKIFAEKFIESPNDDLTDYKIYCFDGEPKFIQVIQNRQTQETIDFFDENWIHQEFYGLNPVCRPSGLPIGRPSGLEKMLEIAKCLSSKTKFLRVDLYNVEGKIYFGEMTFYPASGFGVFTPKEYDLKLGDLIKL